jgi:putative ABC transport system substrate-binding protein
MPLVSRSFTVIVVVVVALLAPPSWAARVALLRARQATAQFDEAIAAFKAEVGEPVVEVVVDEDTTPAALQARVDEAGALVVVAVGARAGQLAAGVTQPAVACMLLQASSVPSSPRLVKVPVVVPARSQIDALRGLVPSIKSIGLLYDPRFNSDDVEEFKAVGKVLRLKVIARSVSDQRATPAALDEMIPDVDALLLPADATVVSKAFLQYLVKRAFDKKIPVMTYSESFVRLGLLAALVPSYADNGRIAGRIAKRLLEGIPPSELEGAAVMRGALFVNKSAGDKMGLTIPARMLAPPTTVVGE